MSQQPKFTMVDAAPTPVGPFSHAAEADGWVFLTGQMPTDPADDSAPLPEGVAAQTRRVMDNLILVLGGLGLTLDNVVSVRGELDSVERKGLAVACIQKTDGVKKFIDLISVKGEKH